MTNENINLNLPCSTVVFPVKRQNLSTIKFKLQGVLQSLDRQDCQMICRNCKFWKRYKYVTDNRKNNGLCDNPKFVYNYYGEEKDCLVYWDSEERQASFDTGEEFGCIHFQGTPIVKESDRDIADPRD